MGIDSDRFTRPVPCKYCGEIYEHRKDCPRYTGLLETWSISYTTEFPKETFRCLQENIYKKIIKVLEELTDKENHSYIDWFVHPDYGDTNCVYCDKHFPAGEHEQHEEDCPIVQARELLEKLK